ncbi:MAG: stage II sporulation protein M [Spirochaetales bacterium]|nr:stage II sporulation protein M [Spirochaetales bacterium]
MTPAAFIQKRSDEWKELEEITAQLEYRQKREPPQSVLRFGRLYRSICTDLSIASAFRLPSETVRRLERLVSRAHGTLYSAGRFQATPLLRYLFDTVPGAIRRDRLVQFSTVLFYSFFMLSLCLGYFTPDFARDLVGTATLQNYQEMHQERSRSVSAGDAAMGSGFYIMNNVSINLTCFGLGILGGIGSLYIMIYNALHLGSVIGFLLGTPAKESILSWIPIHAPLELTAIGISTGAGMRLGLSLVLSGNLPRLQSLQEGARKSVPIIVGAALCTTVAAFLEALFAPLDLPLIQKVLIGLCMLLLLWVYLAGGLSRALRQ